MAAKEQSPGEKKRERQLDKQFHDAVGKLDIMDALTNGLPPATEKTESIYGRLTEYLNSLREIYTVFVPAIPDPESVFVGEFQNGGTHYHRDKDRQIPPPYSHILYWMNITTPNQDATIKHSEQMAVSVYRDSKHLLPIPPGDPTEEFTIKRATPDHSTRTFEFPGWELKTTMWAWDISHLQLIPKERPEYSQHWIAKYEKEAEQKLSNDAVEQITQRIINRNYCSENFRLHYVSTLNIGSIQRLEAVLERLGWKRFQDKEIIKYIEDVVPHGKQFYHVPERPDLPILSADVLDTDINVSGHLTPDQKMHIKKQFYEFFRQTAYGKIKDILRDQAKDGIYDLSPEGIVSRVLGSLGQNLERSDRSKEKPILNLYAVYALIEVFSASEFPKLKEIARHLVTLVSLHEEEKSQGALQYGWKPEEMKLHIPASALRE